MERDTAARPSEPRPSAPTTLHSRLVPKQFVGGRKIRMPSTVNQFEHVAHPPNGNKGGNEGSSTKASLAIPKHRHGHELPGLKNRNIQVSIAAPVRSVHRPVPAELGEKLEQELATFTPEEVVRDIAPSTHHQLQVQHRIEPHSHVDMKARIESGGGWEAFASELAYHGTEFTYLTVDPNNAYKFSLANKAPKDLINERWVTLSLQGIARGGSGEDLEITSFKDLVVQQEVFRRLRAMPLFALYPLWKSMLVWTTMVKRRSQMRRLRTLRPRLHAHDPAILPVYTRVVDICIWFASLILGFSPQNNTKLESLSQVSCASHRLFYSQK